jgi:hypothetical protein
MVTNNLRVQELKVAVRIADPSLAANRPTDYGLVETVSAEHKARWNQLGVSLRPAAVITLEGDVADDDEGYVYNE